MARYAGAMFDAVPTLRRFMLYRKVPWNLWQRASSSSARDAQAGESRPFKRSLAIET